MPRNVHEADPETARQVEVGESQIDGHPPALLFLEPIGVDAGQRSREGAFAVVDMAGGSDDGVPGGLRRGGGADARPGAGSRGGWTIAGGAHLVLGRPPRDPRGRPSPRP